MAETKTMEPDDLQDFEEQTVHDEDESDVRVPASEDEQMPVKNVREAVL